MKGGACLEVFEFPIKGKPEPRHASLLRLLGAWAKIENEKKASRYLNELMLSKLLQDKALVVDAHDTAPMELDAEGAFLFG